MDSCQKILMNKLLNQYERSAHFTQVCTSNRRVLIKTDKNDFPEYDFQNVEVRDRYNASILELAEQGIISIKWLCGSGNNVAQELWLNLERLSDAYNVAARKPLTEQLDAFTTLFIECAEVCHDKLLKDRLTAEAGKLIATKKLNGLCKNGITSVKEILTAVEVFDSLESDGMTMRAFSILCYHDSKYFEKIVKRAFLTFMRGTYPELQELVDQGELGEREQLCYLGIYPRPEVYELAGYIRLLFESGVFDLLPLGSLGGALCGNAVNGIVDIDIGAIDSILFIENKTNYDEYLLRAFHKNQLVLFHGGFTSPQKKKLLQKLAKAVGSGVKVLFWADIDMGGFKMFWHLAQIFPQLKPYRMSSDDVERFHTLGLKRGKVYLDKLSILRDDMEYRIFHSTIDIILRYRVTIEQEVMLKDFMF